MVLVLLIITVYNKLSSNTLNHSNFYPQTQKVQQEIRCSPMVTLFVFPRPCDFFLLLKVQWIQREKIWKCGKNYLHISFIPNFIRSTNL